MNEAQDKYMHVYITQPALYAYSGNTKYMQLNT
jgi:hypothetical protein